MHASKSTAAHFTYVDELDATELVKLRKDMKDAAAARGAKLTFLPFLMKAVVSAMKQFPTLNGLTDDARQEFVVRHEFNFGIAVDTDQGLIVPVVKHADRRSILELAIEIERLAKDAREGKSKLDDLKDGTFTITNAGNIGGLFATPVINYPEAAIMGVHAIKQKPWVVDGKIEIRDIMYLSVSIDHRMNDGATGARWMNHVISLLTDPKRLLLEM
ncbi:MAG: Dihydrolipoyllysine-residue acetyltransferase component of pyruvate dehydrogenase complex [Planctomycetes bacterium]|nr:Dihydrolipoyllysine-residue acetyltransferase component of pyruvate dehydrogenase complex [Planctomycetota bacterium]